MEENTKNKMTVKRRGISHLSVTWIYSEGSRMTVEWRGIEGILVCWRRGGGQIFIGEKLLEMDKFPGQHIMGHPNSQDDQIFFMACNGPSKMGPRGSLDEDKIESV